MPSARPEKSRVIFSKHLSFLLFAPNLIEVFLPFSSNLPRFTGNLYRVSQTLAWWGKRRSRASEEQQSDRITLENGEQGRAVIGGQGCVSAAAHVAQLRPQMRGHHPSTTSHTAACHFSPPSRRPQRRRLRHADRDRIPRLDLEEEERCPALLPAFVSAHLLTYGLAALAAAAAAERMAPRYLCDEVTNCSRWGRAGGDGLEAFGGFCLLLTTSNIVFQGIVTTHGDLPQIPFETSRETRIRRDGSGERGAQIFLASGGTSLSGWREGKQRFWVVNCLRRRRHPTRVGKRVTALLSFLAPRTIKIHTNCPSDTLSFAPSSRLDLLWHSRNLICLHFQLGDARAGKTALLLQQMHIQGNPFNPTQLSASICS